jgi:dihydrofolate reductase
MRNKNMVFIATSLDGYISDKDGGLDWLHSLPNPDNLDFGYSKFIKKVDAIVMGRVTFEVVCSFDVEWPYTLPVFVMSNTLTALPDEYRDKAEIVKGSLQGILDQIHQRGYTQLYIDGGATVQSFLKEDLIDEIIITTIPILLGGGTPLFAELPQELEFEHLASERYPNTLVQNHYRRKRSK